MRAAQYGKGKKPKAPDAGYAFRGLGKKLDQMAVETQRVRVDPTMWGTRAVGLAGPNAALPARRIRYRPVNTALYADGTTGAPVTLRLNHKSATWVDGARVDVGKRRTSDGLKAYENPIVTKPYSVVKTSHS